MLLKTALWYIYNLLFSRFIWKCFGLCDSNTFFFLFSLVIQNDYFNQNNNTFIFTLSSKIGLYSEHFKKNPHWRICFYWFQCDRKGKSEAPIHCLPYVLWPGIEITTCWCTRQYSNQRSHLARAYYNFRTMLF